MIFLSELLDEADLAQEIEAGYVRERSHPDDPYLVILNYTERTQYERRWNDVTRTCRGLIVQRHPFSGEAVVVARPWPKFFNYGEHEDGSLDLSAAVEVMDKVDGSLGILYPDPSGEWSIATRGSFESEQAIHATAWLRKFMAETGWCPSSRLTYLFEIVYPGNRIVVDYADRDELVLLGVRSTATGLTRGPTAVRDWPGARAATFDADTLADALALEPRPNAEGVVVRHRGGLGPMVKIKQDDYIRLHKLVTGLSERSIWEHLNEHDNIGSLLEQIPDEFHDWVLDVSGKLLDQHLDIYAQAWAAHQAILDRLPHDFDRAEYAEHAKRYPDPGLLFMLLDGKDTGPAIYKMIRPVGHRPMTHRTEDEA